MHKINLGASKRESLRETEGEREVKGKELIRNVRKGRIKKQIIFLNKLGGQGAGKEKKFGVPCCDNK